MAKATKTAAPAPKKTTSQANDKAGAAQLQETDGDQVGDQAGAAELQETDGDQAGDQAGAAQLQETGGDQVGDQAGAVQLQGADEAQVGEQAGVAHQQKAGDAPTSDPSNPPPLACYEVLAPFWFRGGVIKPPAWVRMDAAEAFQYQEAGVLGTEPGDA